MKHAEQRIMGDILRLGARPHPPGAVQGPPPVSKGQGLSSGSISLAHGRKELCVGRFHLLHFGTMGVPPL